MSENPKEKKDGTWEEDQKEHEYYYDDAHGYEEYQPDKGDEDEDEDEDDGPNAESLPHSQVGKGSLPPLSRSQE